MIAARDQYKRNGGHETAVTSAAQLSFLGAGRLCLTVAAGEFLYATRGIDEFLFAGEKRMASGANADLDVPTRRAGMVDRAAGADNIRLVVFRMNVRFHGGKRAGMVDAKAAPRK